MNCRSLIVNIPLIRCLALALGDQSHGSLPYFERLLLLLNCICILKEWHIVIGLFLVLNQLGVDLPIRALYMSNISMS